MSTEAEARNAERELRAAARTGRTTVEIVALGYFKPSSYAFSTPEGRLAAVRLSNIIRRFVAWADWRSFATGSRHVSYATPASCRAR